MVNGVPEAALRSVLTRFGLADARVERSFDASTRNDNLLVVNEAGEQFVLRRFRRNRDVPRIEFSVALPAAPL